VSPSPHPDARSVAAAGSGLNDPRVKAILAQLHGEAGRDLFLLARMIPAIVLGRLKKVPLAKAAQPIIAKGNFGVFPTVGNLLYLSARAVDARLAVEFGTSFGISAIYLAAAMRDNGGHFVGSDIDPNKVAGARRNLTEAGLSAFAEVREGDVLETFRDLATPIDLALLDGDKDLYLPVLELLKPKLRKGSVVIADNILQPFFVRKTMALYVAYMNDPANGFRSATLPIGAGLEYSVFEG
jgi:predicted O-methyltransferase YrrM